MRQINNGFDARYYLTEDGVVFNQDKQKYIYPTDGDYKLKTASADWKGITQKKLYELVYGGVWCQDDTIPLPEEEFKEIPGTEGKYLVSNKGRVKSLAGQQAYILTPVVSKNGYLRLQIKQDGVYVNKLVASLVAQVWFPPAPYGYEIHHKRGKEFNGVDDIMLVSHAEHLKIHRELREKENKDNGKVC